MKYFLSSAYIAAVVAANFTATWFLPIPLPIKISVGTFLFSVVFTLRDRVHCHGYRHAWGTVVAAAFTNLLLSAAGAIPIRIVVASFLAILISEGVDTEVFQRSNLTWLKKVYLSNAISIPLDSVLFVAIAFAGVLPAATAVQLVIGQTLVKYFLAALTGMGLVKTVRSA